MTMDTKDVISQLNAAKAIIDDCIRQLSKSKAGVRERKPASAASTKTALATVDFELNERNFIRTYAKKLSGPKKFVLLLARLVKGKVGVDVELQIIRSKWDKMSAKGLMGYKFNLYYPNEAKTRGWVDSKKTGTYHLRKDWMKAFE